jgi:hypothetical protein
MRQKRIRPLPNGKVLNLRDALELMRIDGHSLMLMHANHSKPGDPSGRAYYIVPGGYINATDAKKIIARDDVRPNEDGLFPGCTQTWRMGG